MDDDAARLRAEAVAPYIALIRHELRLPPGADARAGLASRLDPQVASERPPATAPGIIRLHDALAALREGRPPSVTLEQYSDDLRFLQLFAPASPAMERDAMTRLLRDVLADDA